jgi:UDPglucose 6-dehydrogenase
MRIGFVGTGKLGLPVSLVYATKGHDVLCYDVNPNFYNETPLYDNLFSEELGPDNKTPLRTWLPPRETLTYRHTDLKTITASCDLIFVAIQTPHHAEYEGVNRLPSKRVDFDYTFLKEGITALSAAVDREVTVVIISTVLPGTIRREIVPLLNPKIKLCYNPYFIAMGTVARDCLHPEFLLLGNCDAGAAALVTDFYKTICASPVFSTTLENAEMIKVSYNTFISSKIAMANTIMELCHYSPNTDCDEVIRALSLATDRLISPAYLKGGMGDGGGCHPRDNIALSWYSQQKGLRYDWFENIMLAREKQTDFLADLIEEQWKISRLPIYLLGIAFKPNTAIKTGSPAVLLATILKERNLPFVVHDPLIPQTDPLPSTPALFFFGCAHSAFLQYTLPAGSIVLDPHRLYSECLSAGTYIPIGRCPAI